jgi:hypothetical protein
MVLTFALVSISAGLEPLKSYSICESIGTFVTTSFSATPTILCNLYPVTWEGIFSARYCPNTISISETLNSTSTYTNLVNLGGTTCFETGAFKAFSFNIDPFRCLPGTYYIQIYLQTSTEPKISCLDFSYSIG